MKTEKRILFAFLLNLAFSIFEAIGGIWTGSVAILSDALHDLGDAASIGISYFLERKSKKEADERYSYGYGRYSALGSLITTLILLLGSIGMICGAISRIFSPVEIRYNGMIVFAVVGVCVNLCAAAVTHGGESLNQRAVNLYMLEDVLGWIVVLVGALVMKFTHFTLIDPLMSIAVSVFILVGALRVLGECVALFLERTPHGMEINEIRAHIAEIDGVLDVHHIHLRSIDGHVHDASMHIVTDADPGEIKQKVREELREHGIAHTTLELETSSEHCDDRHCHAGHEKEKCCGHHHHHGHGHHHH